MGNQNTPSLIILPYCLKTVFIYMICFPLAEVELAPWPSALFVLGLVSSTMTFQPKK